MYVVRFAEKHEIEIELDAFKEVNLLCLNLFLVEVVPFFTII